MMSRVHQLLWGAAWAVGLLWFIVGALAPSTFLISGAVVYGLLLVLFLAAELRSQSEG
jgi:hypothetical protein